MRNFTLPIANQSRSLDKLIRAMESFDDKLQDLKNRTSSAQETSDKALLLNSLNKDAKLSSKLYTIRNMTKDANDTLADAKMLLKNATNALDDARGATAELCKYPRLCNPDKILLSIIYEKNDCRSRKE